MSIEVSSQDQELISHQFIPSDQNPVIVYIESLAPGSRRTIRGALQLVVDTITRNPRQFAPDQFPWWKLRSHHLMKVRMELSQSHAPATVNKALVATRQVFGFCRRFGLMTADECANAGDVKSVKGSRLPAGRALTPEEFQQLLSTIPNKTDLGARNRALLCLLLQTGMRRAEVVTLSLQDYDRATYMFRVCGKGNKERSVPVSDTLRRELERWLKIRGEQPGPLFYRGHRPGLILRDRPISSEGVYRFVQRMSERAGLLRISPHDFRRTFISTLLDKPGNDLATISKLVGHASVETTTRYDRRGDKAKRRAVNSLDEFASGDAHECD